MPRTVISPCVRTHGAEPDDWKCFDEKRQVHGVEAHNGPVPEAKAYGTEWTAIRAEHWGCGRLGVG